MGKYAVPFIVSMLTAATLMACGGGGGGSGTSESITPGTTATTSSGTITGFGSVFVNGVEFETVGANFEVDDDPNGLESDLKLGMMVTVVGTINNDGVTGDAQQIVFNYDLEGPVSDVPQLDADGLTKRFTVLGTTVIVHKNGTVFDNDDPSFTFDTIDQVDIIEVSGFIDQNGALSATQIEKEEDAVFNPDGTLDDVKIKGTVNNFDVIQNTFNLGTLIVQMTGATELSDLPEGLADGLFVKVEGTLSADGTTLTASEIEREGFDDDAGDVDLEGIITDFVDRSNFRVNRQAVDASNATFEPSGLVLGNGIKVEVEGSITEGILIASNVEGREAKLKIEGTVASVSGNTIAMRLIDGQPTIDVSVDTKTRLEDDQFDVSPFRASNINPGDFLEIEALEDGSANVVATQIERDARDDIVLQGPVRAFDSSAQTLTILGVTVAIDSATAFEGDDDVSIDSAADFFSRLAIGTVVKIKDELVSGVTDGVADEVEFENDEDE